MLAEHPNRDVLLDPADAGAIAGACLGRRVRCTATQRRRAGKCCAVYRLDLDSPPYRAVVKTDAGDENEAIPREQPRLKLAGKLAADLAPRMYGADTSRTAFPFSWLLLEALDGDDLTSLSVTPAERDRLSIHLADALCELHSRTRPAFGEIDEEAGEGDWREVFLPRLAENRRDVDDLLPGDVLAEVDLAIAAAPDALAEFGRPTLVHGDVWAGNIIAARRDGGIELSGLVDWPAMQYADVEYELAYLEAWGTVTDAFRARYTRRMSFRDGYQRRRLFYWLNTYMLHVWFFGAEIYGELVARSARQINRTRRL